MKNTYTDILEQIITEMKGALHSESTAVIDSDYRQWLDFLRHVHPESKLLENDNEPEAVPVQNARDDPPTDGLKVYEDLREIIRLAATNNHPTWYIQPHFTGSIATFTYENGELQNALPINGVPKTIDGFSGTVNGVWLSEQRYIACDVDTKMSFVQRIDFLKITGFTTTDFALFPTDKLLTVSVSKLETSLINFISTARTTWAQVDGAVIVSDSPLFGGDSNRIIYKPHNLPSTL
jgi:hypothetical protein